MTAESKTKAQLIEELEQLRQRVAEFEGSNPEKSLLENNISQTIIDTSPAFFVIIDFAGKTKMMNKSMLEALGYSEEEIQGKDYLSTFVPERDRASLSRLFQKELLKGKPTTNRNHVLTKDGRELYCEWQGRPLSGPKGEVELFCGVGLDITDREQGEEERRRSENIMQARLRLIQFAVTHSLDELLQATLNEAEALTGSSIGFYHFLQNDQKTLTLQTWSTNTLENMCTAEGKGMHYDVDEAGVWVDCVHERRPVIHNDYATLSHRKGLPEGHTPVVRELVVPVMRGNKIVAIIGVGNKSQNYNENDVELVSLLADLAWDIAERKQSEEQLRKLSRAVEYSPATIVVTDLEGTIEYVNPRFTETTGYSYEEAIGKNPRILKSGLTTKEEYEHLWKTIKSGKEWRGEFCNVKKNGDLYWELASISPIFDQVSEITHFVAVKEDITERKRMEDEQKRLAEADHKHHLELQKLREISKNMRKADGSQDLIQVFTKEVQKLCQADLASSMLFKDNRRPVTFFAPGTNSNLSDEQSEAILKTLSDMEVSNVATRVPGFASMLLLPLQSLDNIHGAVLVASREQEAFTDDQKNLLNATADMAGTALNRIDIWETLEDRVRQRTRNLVVLYNLITIISENWRLHDLLELSLVLTLETTNADRGIIYLKDEKDFSVLKPIIQRGFPNDFQFEVASLPDYKLARDVFEKQKPLALNNLADNPAFAKSKEMNSYAGIPITARGEARGVFSLFSNGRDAFGDEEMALLASIADHLGIGIDNSILYEQSRESAALEERNRLARDLHDAVSQLLYSMTLMAGTTRKMLERGSDLDAVQHSVERLEETAHRALKEMRLLLFELRPAVLDSEGLVGALQYRIKSVEDGLGVSVKLQAQGLPELPSSMEDALYHIAMEALNNIIKHAESKTALIKFSVDAGDLVMEISDDGKGFDTDLLQKGSGLRNMRERGQMLGSEVIVDSKPGRGTRVVVEVNLPSESEVSSNEVFNG